MPGAGGSGRGAGPTGEELYMQFCATCHGVEAKGDGPMVPLLLTEPPDLTRLAAETGGEFPVFHAVRMNDGRDPLLVHGGAMPAQGDVFAGERSAAVTTASGQPVLASKTIARVVEHLRTLQGRAAGQRATLSFGAPAVAPAAAPSQPAAPAALPPRPQQTSPTMIARPATIAHLPSDAILNSDMRPAARDRTGSP